MGDSRNGYVVRSNDSGWDVIREGDRRPTTTTETRQAAVAAAKRLSRDAGGEFRVLGRSGKISRSAGVAARTKRR
jgi:predicted deacylase